MQKSTRIELVIVGLDMVAKMKWNGWTKVYTQDGGFGQNFSGEKRTVHTFNSPGATFGPCWEQRPIPPKVPGYRLVAASPTSSAMQLFFWSFHSPRWVSWWKVNTWKDGSPRWILVQIHTCDWKHALQSRLKDFNKSVIYLHYWTYGDPEL